jgi:hypothetical protein
MLFLKDQKQKRNRTQTKSPKNGYKVDVRIPQN